MTAYEGGCRCGNLRFSAVGEPKFVANCHCKDCRRSIGAAFSTWAGFDSAQVSWRKQPAFHESSPGISRGFCPQCGTPLSFSGGKWAGETHLLIGLFDDSEAFRPFGDAFIGEKLSWVRPFRPVEAP